VAIRWDHHIEIWEYGPGANPDEVNSLDNWRALVRDPCDLKKTGRKTSERAKMKRNAAKHAGTYKKSPSRLRGGKLKGRSSFDRWRDFSGNVKTKK
jgi:hypothetical protein